jgi:hypothetical protein
VAFNVQNFVHQSFASLGVRNPLRRLTDTEKTLLVLVLISANHKPRGSFFVDMERMSALAAEAGALGKKIQADIVRAKFGRDLLTMLPWAAMLPLMLQRFATQFGGLLESLAGKPGHKSKTAASYQLVSASEFVRTQTGKYLDEQLADLYQAVRQDDSLEDEFSGDAIRKKREHLKKTYPVLYRGAVNRARELSELVEEICLANKMTNGTMEEAFNAAVRAGMVLAARNTKGAVPAHAEKLPQIF